MRKLIFALTFMLIGTFAFASINVESILVVESESVIELTTDFNSSTMFAKNQTTEESVLDLDSNQSIELIAAIYYCSVEDGHYLGEGTGNTPAQACRRARRDLRRQLR